MVILAPGAAISRKGKRSFWIPRGKCWCFPSTSTDYNIRKPEEPLTHSLADKNRQIGEGTEKRLEKTGGGNGRLFFPSHDAVSARWTWGFPSRGFRHDHP
ncbi:MAG: hypothetical protein ACLT8E_11450 [Akkermansia sp.]